MSSNPYHNNPIITRSNYEEFLLLYVDNELNMEEKAAVDQFLLLNPDLARELEILQQAKLPEEFIRMDKKESLLSGSMKIKASDETLLLYVDNELDEAKRHVVEKKLEQDDIYRLQYELLLKTKSTADEIVACTFKDKLYRHEKRNIPALWWYAAAAVLLALSMGTFIITSQQNDQPNAVALRLQRGQKTVRSGSDTIILNTNNEMVSIETLTDTAFEEPDKNPAESIDEKVPVLSVHKVEKKSIVNNKDAANVQSIPLNEETDVVQMPARSNNGLVIMPKLVEEPVKESLTKDPVTSDKSYAYNQIDASVNSIAADADDEEKSRSSLKGLLRKATRFVERRTNINVTNEDDELLIGAVAISLK